MSASSSSDQVFRVVAVPLSEVGNVLPTFELSNLRLSPEQMQHSNMWDALTNCLCLNIEHHIRFNPKGDNSVSRQRLIDLKDWLTENSYQMKSPQETELRVLFNAHKRFLRAIRETGHFVSGETENPLFDFESPKLGDLPTETEFERGGVDEVVDYINNIAGDYGFF
jgi:hypothetical protein